jgi:hypothetical protein
MQRYGCAEIGEYGTEDVIENVCGVVLGMLNK